MHGAMEHEVCLLRTRRLANEVAAELDLHLAEQCAIRPMVDTAELLTCSSSSASRTCFDNKAAEVLVAYTSMFNADLRTQHGGHVPSSEAIGDRGWYPHAERRGRRRESTRLDAKTKCAHSANFDVRCSHRPKPANCPRTDAYYLRSVYSFHLDLTLPLRMHTRSPSDTLRHPIALQAPCTGYWALHKF